MAVYTNRNRPKALWKCYDAASSALNGWAKRLRQLRAFYFKVAEMEVPNTADLEECESIKSSDDDEMLWLSWEDHLPVSWQVQCLHGHFKVPGAFLTEIIHWICAAERLDGAVRVVSDLELVFALLLDKEVSFPFSVDGTLALHMRRPDDMFQRPTVAMMLRPLQHAMHSIHRLFSFVIRTPALPNPELGVYMKYEGTRLRVPNELGGLLRSRVQLFTSKRAVR